MKQNVKKCCREPPQKKKISRNFNHYPVVDVEAARSIHHDGPIQPWSLSRLPLSCPQGPWRQSKMHTKVNILICASLRFSRHFREVAGAPRGTSRCPKYHRICIYIYIYKYVYIYIYIFAGPLALGV